MAVLRRLGQGEAFSPAIAMDRIDAELPDSLHRKMTYVRDYARILAETGELTPAKWGVLEEVAEAVPLLAQKLNLRADQAVKAAVQGQVTARATQGQRMAGQAVQHAMAREMPYRRPTGYIDVGGRRLEVYSRADRDPYFTERKDRGSGAAVDEFLENLTGPKFNERLARLGAEEWVHRPRDHFGINEMGGVEVDIPHSAIQWGPDLEQSINRDPDSSIGWKLDHDVRRLLANKYSLSHHKRRTAGRIEPDMTRHLHDYRWGGLHASSHEREMQQQTMDQFWKEAVDRRLADQADDPFRMLGNFLSPHVDDGTVVSGLPSLYRGDVLPVEQFGRTRHGESMQLRPGAGGQTVGSFALEPFAAYRYAYFNQDGRTDRARRASPSGQIVRRIVEVKPRDDELVPILDADPQRIGRSELLYPLNRADRKLVMEKQIFHGNEPDVPLIWQTYQ